MKYFAKLEKPALILAGLFAGLVLIEVCLQGYGLYLDAHRSYLEPELEGKVRILALGESTTDPLAAPEQKPWTYFLEEKLNQLSDGKKYVVINKGRSGTSTHFILRDLPEYLKTYRPHLTITMMGLNDVSDLAFLHDESFFARLKIVRLITNILNHRPETPAPAQEKINELMNLLKQTEDLSGWMKKNPELKWYAYQQLAHNAFWKEKRKSELTGNANFTVPFNYARESLKENPYNDITLQLLIFSGHKQFESEAREILKDILRKGYSPSSLVAPWFDLISYQTDPELIALLEDKGLSKITTTKMEVISRNYIQVANLIRESGGKLAVMAYPTTNIDLYRQLFVPGSKFTGFFLKNNFYENFPEVSLKEEFRDIIFIANQNFPKTFDKEYYTDFMVNEPAGGFGHTTLKGHQQIGENAYQALRKLWLKNE